MSIFKIIQFIYQYDKMGESNQQMMIRIGVKFLILIIIILIFDSLLDWLLGGIHAIAGLIHFLMNAVEYFLELVVEHGLQINYRQNEIIIINIIVIGLLYILYRHIRDLYLTIKRTILFFYFKFITKESIYWQSLSLARKMNLIICYLIGFSCLLFLFIL